MPECTRPHLSCNEELVIQIRDARTPKMDATLTIGAARLKSSRTSPSWQRLSQTKPIESIASV